MEGEVPIIKSMPWRVDCTPAEAEAIHELNERQFHEQQTLFRKIKTSRLRQEVQRDEGPIVPMESSPEDTTPSPL